MPSFVAYSGPVAIMVELSAADGRLTAKALFFYSRGKVRQFFSIPKA